MYLFKRFAEWKQIDNANMEADVEADNVAEEDEETGQIGIYRELMDTDASRPFTSGPMGQPSKYLLPVTPSFPNMTVWNIILKHKASKFMECLNHYIHNHTPSRRHIDDTDRIHVFKQFRVLHPKSPFINNLKRPDTIRASPEVPKKVGYDGMPERFDPVLVHCIVPNDGHLGRPLAGEIPSA